mmetsp:Transcript_40324/g.90526  ORF Transcript_40324/g.90526 Transcript_40324/m.90526 type:complete len:290 (-) Transcript_40324:149-1018(-)
MERSRCGCERFMSRRGLCWMVALVCSTLLLPSATGLLLVTNRPSFRRMRIRTSVSAEPSFTPSSEEIAAAVSKLTWELWKEKESAPVLDLSRRESRVAAFESISTARDDPSRESQSFEEEGWAGEEWVGGSVWVETVRGLGELGVFDCGGSLVDSQGCREILALAPQLLRLPTQSVLDSARFVVEEAGLGAGSLVAEPSLLVWPAEDLRYALKFLSTMMALKSGEAVRQACAAQPALLLAGVEGGFQERAVADAFGSAAAATSKAKEAIVNDAMAAARQLRSKQDPKGI